MKCLFGHKYGKIDHGVQYCERCNKAKIVPVPHPCKSKTGGHFWKDLDVETYDVTTRYQSGDSHKRKKKFYQSCVNCGEKRAIWV